MRILYYSGHPAQYHFFKNVARNLVKDGHKVKMLIKTKDILEDIIKEDGWDYENIQLFERTSSKFSILKSAFSRTRKVICRARKFKADILIGTDSSIAQAAWFLRKPAITTLEDDIEVISKLAMLTYPFTSNILVPEVCRVGKWEKKKIPYNGYMKLAYLHPAYFASDKAVLEKYGISGKFILIRLAKLTAHHDTGVKGLNLQLVHNVRNIAENNGYKVYISSEGEIDQSLADCQLRINYTDIHHIMAFASLLVSDSQSMSMEAAMLGLPSLRFSDFAGRISVLEELESKYGLTFGIPTSEPQRLLDTISQMLSNVSLTESFAAKRNTMLCDKIDVTAFLTWFIENYPSSRQILRQNPERQLNFKTFKKA